MAKHTPGPWKMRKRDGGNGDGWHLGWDFDWDHPEENTPPTPERGVVVREADAHLIAAAPELLEACKLGLDLIRVLRPRCDHHGEVIAMRAAIEKAEGR